MQVEIAELKNVILNTPTESTINGLGVFFIACAILTVFLSLFLATMGEVHIWPYFVAVGELALGLGLKPSEQQIAENREKVSIAKMELEEKEKRLKELAE